MNEIKVIALAVSLSALFSVAHLQHANAHKPLTSQDNNDIEQATVIPDHRVSWAVYDELYGKEVADYYQFNAIEGERFYMQMTVPNLEQHADFAPSIAVIGDGLDHAELAVGRNSVVRNAQNEVDGLIPNTATSAIIMDYNLPESPDTFFEPFTQTSYLVRQELVIDDLPSSGVYSLVVFDKNLGENESGKYVLAVGEIEDFSPIDYFTTLPEAWFQTKLYFEDYFSIVIAIVAIVGTFSLTGLTLSRKLRKKFGAIKS